MFAHPRTQPWLVFANDLDAVVGAAAVDDDVFQVGIALQQDGSNRLLEECGLVKTGCDNRDAWPPHGVLRSWEGPVGNRPWPSGFSGRWQWEFRRIRLISHV